MDKVLIKGVSFYLSNLKEEHIDKLVLFNKEIYNDLEKKSYFIIPKKKDFLNHLKNKSKVLILFNSDKQIVAYLITSFFQEKQENWVIDFNILKRNVKHTAKLDSVAILKDYRLKGIYNFFVSYIFKYLKKNKYKHAVAHVHPKNKKSLDLVLNLGFRIIKKEKYLKSVRLFLIKDI